MCDYSLEARESRPARIGEYVKSAGFPGTPTRGFCAAGEPSVAVCLLPGTELGFDEPVSVQGWWPMIAQLFRKSQSRTAIFRKINEDLAETHHDALELDDGRVVLLTRLRGGQVARILQLPAAETDRTTAREAAPAVEPSTEPAV